MQLSLFLGGLSILAMISSFLALIDIGHRESDPSLEWNVLRVAFLIIVLFQVSALVTLGRVFGLTRSCRSR